MQILASWHEPESVATWRWQHGYLPACKKLSVLSVFGIALFAAVSAVMTKIYLPSALLMTLSVSLGAMLVFPAIYLFAFWVDAKIWDEAPCYLYDSGFRHRGFYSWQNVSSYYIAKHQHLAGVSYLCLKMQQGERRLHFKFHDIDEEDIQAALNGRVQKDTNP